MAKLEVKNLKQQYLYGTTGVNDLSFEVEDGSYVILGGEESGKSSLFRVLSGKEAPFKGEVFYNGLSLDKIALKERSIVYVRERGGVFPFRSVEYNMEYPLKIRKYEKDEIEKRVTHALNLAQLTKYRKKRAGALSKFDLAKLKLARCFLRDTEYCFIDEVQKKLTVRDREELSDNLMMKIKERRGVKIFASDDYREAKRFANQGCVLYYGITEQTGNLDDFYLKPKTPEVFRMTHGEPTIEEGRLDSFSGMIMLKDKKIFVEKESVKSFYGDSVLILSAQDGFTKIYDAENEKLIDFD